MTRFDYKATLRGGTPFTVRVEFSEDQLSAYLAQHAAHNRS
jgi:hypothetical protein